MKRRKSIFDALLRQTISDQEKSLESCCSFEWHVDLPLVDGRISTDLNWKQVESKTCPTWVQKNKETRMPRNYAILDVFTAQALCGNPLAVVLDSDGLTDDQMQSIAKEFNISETVFVLPADNPALPVPIRIFTPTDELPFAGHPTVGTSVLLAHNRFGEVKSEQDAVIVLSLKSGIIRSGVVLQPKQQGFAEFDTPLLPEKKEYLENKDAIATALGIESVEIGFENHRSAIYDAGVQFHFVPVRDIAVVQQVKPNLQSWNAAFGYGAVNSAFIYCRETKLSDSHFHARMFAPNMGIPEDPATGSAVAAFAGVINEFDAPLTGLHRIKVEQGFEMGRPSVINLEIDISNQKIRTVRIGGNAVIVARGELYI